MLSRRRLLAAGGAAALLGGRLRAESESRFFRIGTGGTSGTYFPLGGEMASALSDPPGSRPCERGGSCGVPGLIAVAQATEGSVENVEAVAKGALESALCQADVAAWAFAGSAPFDKAGPMANLRVLANLYAESLHIVVRGDGPVHVLKDLKGRRVALGEPESGTLADARLLLAAAGLADKELKPSQLKLDEAVDGLRQGTLDALFEVAGYPVPAIEGLAGALPIRLVPVAPETVQRLSGKYRFFAPDVIPGGTYAGLDQPVATVGIGSLWIASTRLDDALAYALVKALWHPSTRRLLDSGHPIGKRIVLAHALDGLSLPLHPGAERYYREAGLAIPPG